MAGSVDGQASWEKEKNSVKLVIAVLLTITAGAADKHLPIPSTILTAKTIFIDNQTELSYIGDQAYEETTKWARFRVVDNKGQADLVFLLTATVSTTLTVVDAKTGQALFADSKAGGVIRQRAPIKSAINELRKRIEEQLPPPPKKH